MFVNPMLSVWLYGFIVFQVVIGILLWKGYFKNR
ncbi:hypothetical protein M948_03870 [Virgibacillus sp. CM-4]|uniref:Uncharacterized protein n=1 Tax=Virgibacillus massiliensis TaxID=1462526 RepID=A0A024Q963_9BACI|nr:hypothetical protein M948_03870 [Virgibacillus sp. CM-4]CDQ38770.1 hypothetical protein BN990_01045 [Virgibacillus massiliensis]